VSLKINRIIHEVEGRVLSYMLGFVRIIYCCVSNWSTVCVFGMPTTLRIVHSRNRYSISWTGTRLYLSLHHALWYSHSSFTNRYTFIDTM